MWIWRIQLSSRYPPKWPLAIMAIIIVLPKNSTTGAKTTWIRPSVSRHTLHSMVRRLTLPAALNTKICFFCRPHRSNGLCNCIGFAYADCAHLRYFDFYLQKVDNGKQMPHWLTVVLFYSGNCRMSSTNYLNVMKANSALITNNTLYHQVMYPPKCPQPSMWAI